MQLLGLSIPAPEPEPRTWEQWVDRCRSCVGPVGEWTQRGGVVDPASVERVESLAMAALMAERWRDVRGDVIEYGRLYLPADMAARHGLDLPLLRKALRLDADRGCGGDGRDGQCDCALMPRADMLALRGPFRGTMHELVGHTEGLLEESTLDKDALPVELAQPLHALTLEAASTLKLIKRHDYDTLTRRPTLGALPRVWNRLRLRLGR